MADRRPLCFSEPAVNHRFKVLHKGKWCLHVPYKCLETYRSPCSHCISILLELKRQIFHHKAAGLDASKLHWCNSAIQSAQSDLQAQQQICIRASTS